KAIENVPKQGIGYGINRYLRKILKSEKSLPQIFFNYLGEFFDTRQTNDLCLSSYETGDSISQECEREYILDIKGQILENRLQFTFDYSKEQLKKYDMDAFVEAFEEAIMQLIGHCDKAVRVGDHVLNQTQLSNVLSHLNQLEE
ncbi:MAG: condensation domain-containing protein, partial [Eubacteriales bacterium]|nr:condensation domain-containing protein [Eubacteriales bacterium]